MFNRNEPKKQVWRNARRNSWSYYLKKYPKCSVRTSNIIYEDRYRSIICEVVPVVIQTFTFNGIHQSRFSVQFEVQLFGIVATVLLGVSPNKLRHDDRRLRRPCTRSLTRTPHLVVTAKSSPRSCPVPFPQKLLVLLLHHFELYFLSCRFRLVCRGP